jgi:hypothetical protein
MLPGGLPKTIIDDICALHLELLVLGEFVSEIT